MNARAIEEAIAVLATFREHQVALHDHLGAMTRLVARYPWRGDYPHTAEEMRRIGREMRVFGDAFDKIAERIEAEPVAALLGRKEAA